MLNIDLMLNDDVIVEAVIFAIVDEIRNSFKVDA
jgi:hypothetical protein